MELNERIEKDFQIAIELFARFENIHLTFSEESVATLDRFINEKRDVFDDDTINRMTATFGSFLGETIRRNYGGSWDDINGELGIRFDEKNAIFPYAKLRKQFENGAEDSILSFYQVIPIVFRLSQ